jgi:hypothetical protein
LTTNADHPLMKFTSAKEIATKAAAIKAYVREAMAAEKAGMKVETKPPEFPVPEELKEKFRNDPRLKRAFEALTPGRQRGYLFHFAGAKQSETRTARIEKAMPAIFEGKRVPGAAIDRETVDAYREICACLTLMRTGCGEHRASDPSEVCALEFKGKLRLSATSPISATNAVNWSNFQPSQRQPGIPSRSLLRPALSDAPYP